MATTYEPIATTTLTSAAASVTFNSFSGYTDLVLVMNAKNSGGANYNLYARVNSDTGSNYSTTYLGGAGSVVYSGRDTSAAQMRLGLIGNANFTPVIANFQNYANGTTYKTILGRGSDAGGNVIATVNLWRSTSSITSIVLFPELSANFSSGSTFTLYGIASA